MKRLYKITNNIPLESNYSFDFHTKSTLLSYAFTQIHMYFGTKLIPMGDLTLLNPDPTGKYPCRALLSFTKYHSMQKIIKENKKI